MDDEVKIIDILTVWVNDLIEGLPLYVDRLKTTTGVNRFFIMKTGGSKMTDMLASIDNLNREIEAFLFVDGVPLGKGKGWLEVDLRDPSAGERIRAHLEKYS
jgi:hypothetical protein